MSFLRLPQARCTCGIHINTFRKKYDQGIAAGIPAEEVIRNLNLKRGCCLKNLHVERFYVPSQGQGGSQISKSQPVSKTYTIDRANLVPINSVPDLYQEEFSDSESDDESDEDYERKIEEETDEEKKELLRYEMEARKMKKQEKESYIYSPEVSSSTGESSPVEKIRSKKKKREIEFEEDLTQPSEIRGLPEPDQRGTIDLKPGTVISTGWARDNKGNVLLVDVGMDLRSVHVSTLSL